MSGHDTVTHVHETHLSAPLIELSPPHPPRVETPEYKKAHDFLIHQKKQGCHICGVNIDTLNDPTINTCGARQIESHHYPIERSLATACDPLLIHRDFPQVYDMASLMQFVDSPANLLVSCDVHHRGTETGIHHLLTQDWIIQRYLRQGYKVVADAKDAAAAEAQDAQVVGDVPEDAAA